MRRTIIKPLKNTKHPAKNTASNVVFRGNGVNLVETKKRNKIPRNVKNKTVRIKENSDARN